MIVCEECGSTEIQTQAWVDANTHEYIGETGIDREDNCGDMLMALCGWSMHSLLIKYQEKKEQSNE